MQNDIYKRKPNNYSFKTDDNIIIIIIIIIIIVITKSKFSNLIGHQQPDLSRNCTVAHVMRL